MAERRNLLVQLVASTIGLAMIVALVTGLSYVFASNDRPENVAILGNLFAIPLAIAAWTGVLWKDKGVTFKGPESWRNWVMVFFYSSAAALIFIIIDVAVVHPGISLVFTFAACSFSIIALPSAIRAWLLYIFMPATEKSAYETFDK